MSKFHADFVGCLDIPGAYKIITTTMFKGNFYVLILTEQERTYCLYKVDLDTAQVCVQTITEAAT